MYLLVIGVLLYTCWWTVGKSSNVTLMTMLLIKFT